MRKLSACLLALLPLGATAADADHVATQLAQDPVAQACSLLAERGNATAAEHLAAIREQLLMLEDMEAAMRDDSRPEGEMVQRMQRVMRAAAEARSWCAAVPLQTDGAPAQTQDADVTREWVRQGVRLAYERRDCEQVLSGGDDVQGKAYQDCQRLRDQLQRWDG